MLLRVAIHNLFGCRCAIQSGRIISAHDVANLFHVPGPSADVQHRSTIFHHFPKWPIRRFQADWRLAAHDCTVCSRHFRPAAHGWNAKWPAPLGRFAWLLARNISDFEFTAWSTWKLCQTLTTLHWCCFIGPGREKQPLGMEILESLVAILNQAYPWINR